MVRRSAAVALGIGAAQCPSLSGNLPLPAPAKQTQHAEAGGEERECAGKRDLLKQVRKWPKET